MHRSKAIGAKYRYIEWLKISNCLHLTARF